ncbi:hypothetical protein BCEP4_40038 [Burkholderia cepacia]|nr:hypothetical protein BCEP4_40038 [Burkholderia cepacia]
MMPRIISRIRDIPVCHTCRSREFGRSAEARAWQSSIGFDFGANPMYNHVFSARGVRKNWIQSEVLNVRGHKNRRQAVQGCRWRKTQSRTDTG